MNKKAAMEMSVGTLVTIVLLMAVLGLGIFLIREIFTGSTNALTEINEELNNEINKLFSDETTRTVVYPPSREISLEKGESGGVGFKIRNIDNQAHVFSYNTRVMEVARTCTLTTAQAEQLLSLGRTGSNINLASGDLLEPAVLIKLETSDATPLCEVRYQITIDRDGQPYTSDYFDLKVVS